MMPSISGRPFFCSWSGGKDSCLALYHAVQAKGLPQRLFTMMAEGSQVSRSHGLPRPLLEEQSRKLCIPITFRSASWDEYEAAFLEGIQEFKAKGIETGIFGDIDVDSNREWVEGICHRASIAPIEPLWKRSRQALLEEFIGLGFKATIVVINSAKLNPQFLGRAIDWETIKDLEQAGIDPSGEFGEYHTVVTAGPLFSSEIVLKISGQMTHEGYAFLEMST